VIPGISERAGVMGYGNVIGNDMGTLANAEVFLSEKPGIRQGRIPGSLVVLADAA
jgi:hypothetical protein